MNTITIDTFHDALKTYVDQVIATHEPLRVTRHEGEDFIVVSAEEWEREQETRYVLQNSALMRQITESQQTHPGDEGYRPTEEELHEIRQSTKKDPDTLKRRPLGLMEGKGSFEIKEGFKMSDEELLHS